MIRKFDPQGYWSGVWNREIPEGWNFGAGVLDQCFYVSGSMFHVPGFRFQVSAQPPDAKVFSPGRYAV